MKMKWTAGRYAAWVYLQHLEMLNLPHFEDTQQEINILVNELIHIQLIQTTFKHCIVGSQLSQVPFKLYMIGFKERIIALQDNVYFFKEVQTAFKLLMNLIKVFRNIPKPIQITFKLRQTVLQLLQIIFKTSIMPVHQACIHLKSPHRSLKMEILKPKVNQSHVGSEIAYINDHK